jgi:hypothetical protein
MVLANHTTTVKADLPSARDQTAGRDAAQSALRNNNPTPMVEEQLRLGITHKLGDLLAQLSVGDADHFDHCHDNMPWRSWMGDQSADAAMKIVARAIPGLGGVAAS